jgi:hypothetical protein
MREQYAEFFSVPREAVIISEYIGKDLEGSGRGIKGVLSRYLPGGTEKKHQTRQSV